MSKRIAYLVESPLGNYILGQMIVPQLEEDRHSAVVKGMFFIDNNVYLLMKGNPLAERLASLSRSRGIYLQACDQCVFMRNLADKLIEEAKIGCFPDFYNKLLDEIDMVITV